MNPCIDYIIVFLEHFDAFKPICFKNVSYLYESQLQRIRVFKTLFAVLSVLMPKKTSMLWPSQNFLPCKCNILI